MCQAVHSRIETGIQVGYRRALGSGVVGECALTGRTLDIDDARQHANLVDTLGGTMSELCVPVMHDGEVLAVLNAESRRLGAFRGQRALLETVADQIAGILRAARLYQDLQMTHARLQDAYQALQGSADRDGLTGIANRGCFDRTLADALAQAESSGEPLAVLLVDVDHFKAFNDGYGHLAGDACLREIAGQLAGMVEGSPALAARFGGEEFALVLPGGGPEEALRLGERLRRSVEARELAHAHAPTGRVSISVGVAAWMPPADARPEALLARADRALYRAKDAGRNCVRPG